MKTEVIKSQSRGRASYGWLKANYLFSFAQYYNPDRMHFGALRVFNDDIVQSGKGFDTHPHDNMEIITIPLKGAVRHKDSMGHESIIGENEVQVMSAGTGIFHSEYNASQIDELNLFQLWIIPSKRDIEPTYDQKKYEPSDANNQWQQLVSPKGNDGLTIHQNAWIHRTFLNTGTALKYILHQETLGSLLMVVKGEIIVNGTLLEKRDVMTISETEDFTIEATKDAIVLNVEVPNI